MQQIFFGTPKETVTKFTEDRKKKGFNALDSVDGIYQKTARMWQIVALAMAAMSFCMLGN